VKQGQIELKDAIAKAHHPDSVRRAAGAAKPEAAVA
jgi:hypothetical protein